MDRETLMSDLQAKVKTLRGQINRLRELYRKARKAELGWVIADRFDDRELQSLSFPSSAEGKQYGELCAVFNAETEQQLCRAVEAEDLSKEG